MKKKKHTPQHQPKLRVQERSRKPICRNLKNKKLINEKKQTHIHPNTNRNLPRVQGKRPRADNIET